MRKLIGSIAILLIAAALIGPAMLGMLVEDTVTGDDNPLTRGLPPWLEPVAHDYRRGWFSSESDLRLVITDRQRAGPIAAMLDPGRFGDEPAIIVTSRVTHGPLVDLLVPATARIESRLFTDDRDGRRLPLPISATTHVGITGSLRTDWRLAEGGTMTPRGGPAMQWMGASGTFEVAGDGAAEAATLEVDRMEIGSGDAVQRFRDVVLGYAVTRTGSDATLSGSFELDIDGAGMANVTRLAGSASVDGLPQSVIPGALPVLRDIVADSRTIATALGRHERTVRAALGDPLPIRWQQLANTPQGAISVDFDIVLPAVDGAGPGGDALLDAIASGSTITGRIALPVAFADAMQATDPGLHEQLTMLRGIGVLAPDASGEQLVMAIDYSGGELMVNGSPLPVSLNATPP